MAMKRIHSKKFQKKVWIFLAAIIVPAFVLWGAGSATRGQKQIKSVGKVFGKNITPLEFKEAVDATRNRLIMQYGRDITEAQKFINLDARAWERIILLHEAQRRKIDVSDKEVISLISSSPLFQRKGQFDNDSYSRMVTYLFRAQPRKFEEQIRQNRILEKLYSMVTTDVRISDEEIKKAYEKENERVSIYYIAALYSEFAKNLSVTDEILKEYFQKHSLSFKQPLTYNLEYLSCEPESTMKTVYNRLRKKGNLAALAKEFNLSYKETGFFSVTDPIPGIGWVPQLTGVISKARQEEILPPIRMDKNFFIIRVKQIREPFVPEFEAVKDKVKEEYSKNKLLETAKEKIEACLKKLRESQAVNNRQPDLEKTAKEFDLKFGTTDLFTYGSYIEGIGASDNFFTAVRNLKEGEFSQMIETQTGLFIASLKSFVPVEDKKFQEEKAKFLETFLSKKKQEYFMQFLEELKKKTEGPFIETAARQN